GARRPEHREELARRDLQADAVDRPHLAVVLREIDEPDVRSVHSCRVSTIGTSSYLFVAASANDAMSEKVASGFASAAGVAPPPRPSRRSIQTVERPRRLAVTWSWKSDWATWRMRSRGMSMRSKASSKPRADGL